MTQVSYVCTNYNNSSFSIAAADSFRAVFGSDAQVVIVDNGSNRNAVDELNAYAARTKGVHVIDTKVNLGYFSGLNRGLDDLDSLGLLPGWVFAGNNDLVFDPGLSDAFVNARDRLQPYTVVAPNILTLEGRNQNPHIISGISRKRRLLYAIYYRSFLAARLMTFVSRFAKSASNRPDTKAWREGREIWAGHGACYLLSPSFFEKLGRLDDRSFLYFEEAFLALQVQGLGASIWYEPTLKIHHVGNASIGRLPGRKTWEYSRSAHKAYLQLLSQIGERRDRKL